MKSFFAHGKESGPWGSKILHLAEGAKKMGLEVESPDYRDLLELVTHDRPPSLSVSRPRFNAGS